MTPETHYANSGEVNIAYQVIGHGPRDLTLVPGWVSNVEVLWDEPIVARFLSMSASPGAALAMSRMNFDADVRHVLPAILATILFTDIVASTGRAAALGDRRWRDLLEGFYGVVRRELPRFRGLEVSTAGEAACWPRSTVRREACAARRRSIADGVRPLGIKIRTGLHTGECEVIDNNVGGIAVHTAARVGTLAATGGGPRDAHSKGPGGRRPRGSASNPAERMC